MVIRERRKIIDFLKIFCYNIYMINKENKKILKKEVIKWEDTIMMIIMVEMQQ